MMSNNLKKKIYEASKKHKEWSMVITDYLSRPIAYFIAKYTSITPNQISISSFIIGLIGCYFLYIGGPLNIIIGASLAMLYNILDMIDGMIARVKGKSSKVGHWLDGILGFILTPLLIISLAIGIRSNIALILGLFAAVSYPIQYSLVYFYKAEVVSSNDKLFSSNSKLDWLRYSYGLCFFYLFLFIVALINKPLWVLFFWAILGNMYWICIVIIQYISLRKMDSVNRID